MVLLEIALPQLGVENHALGWALIGTAVIFALTGMSVMFSPTRRATPAQSSLWSPPGIVFSGITPRWKHWFRGRRAFAVCGLLVSAVFATLGATVDERIAEYFLLGVWATALMLGMLAGLLKAHPKLAMWTARVVTRGHRAIMQWLKEPIADD